ncbi:MAG: VOC family protein [Paenibacillus sp.]|nr:VOC family protein [Paenibacillus sp.]
MKFTGLCLITEDVISLMEFYKDVLQVEAVGDEIAARLRVKGDYHIDICSKQAMENLAPGSTDGIGYGGCTIEIEVDNVDKEYERLKKLDVKFNKLPQTYPWGRRSLWIQDRDGNIVNMYTNVSSETYE